MLKTIVEDEKVSKVLSLWNKTRGIAIRADDDGYARRAFRDQKRFVAGKVPRDDRTISGTDDDSAGSLTFVTAREDNGTKSFIAKALGKQNDERRLASAANGEVTDTDHRMIEPVSFQNAALIEPVAGVDEESKGPRQSHNCLAGPGLYLRAP